VHQVGAVERPIQVEVVRLIPDAPQHGVSPVECRERFGPAIGQQMLDAPGTARLVHVHFEAARQELACHSAKEVGSAVVPVGHEGVAEQHNAHMMSRAAR
jgi:hypothetical protein